MKKNLIIIIIIISFCNCKSTSISENALKSATISFYQNKYEISKGNIKLIKKDFYGFVNIKELSIDNVINDISDGIYEVSLNITHTTKNLIFIKNNKIEFLELNGNIKDVINAFLIKSNEYDLYNPELKEVYERKIKQITLNNNIIISKKTLGNGGNVSD